MTKVAVKHCPVHLLLSEKKMNVESKPQVEWKSERVVDLM